MVSKIFFLKLNFFDKPIPHSCPVGWGRRIHRLLLCRGGVRSAPPRASVLDMTKQSGGGGGFSNASTPSLPSLLGLLWPGMVAPDRTLPKG